MVKSPPAVSEAGSVVVPLSIVRLCVVEALSLNVHAPPKPSNVSLLKTEEPVMVPDKVLPLSVALKNTSPPLWVKVPLFAKLPPTVSRVEGAVTVPEEIVKLFPASAFTSAKLHAPPPAKDRL